MGALAERGTQGNMGSTLPSSGESGMGSTSVELQEKLLKLCNVLGGRP